jgi:hypothetical protein
VLTASSFSGSIRSDFPVTIGGDSTRDGDSRQGRRPGNDSHNMRATFGDGSATLDLRTFSGNIVISSGDRFQMWCPALAGQRRPPEGGHYVRFRHRYLSH